MTDSFTNPNKSTGFTLVELIVVIVLVGILSIYAAPRFIGSSAVSSSTAQNAVITAARRAQQLAMNLGDPATANVQFSTDNVNKRVRITYNDGAAQFIDYNLPADITITPVAANISYNAMGDPSAGLNITLIGNDTRTICIETTGYAHRC